MLRQSCLSLPSIYGFSYSFLASFLAFFPMFLIFSCKSLPPHLSYIDSSALCRLLDWTLLVLFFYNLHYLASTLIPLSLSLSLSVSISIPTSPTTILVPTPSIHILLTAFIVPLFLLLLYSILFHYLCMQSRVDGVPCGQGFQRSELLKHLQVIGIDCHSTPQHDTARHSTA